MKRADFDSDYDYVISFNLSLITLKSVSIEIKIHESIFFLITMHKETIVSSAIILGKSFFLSCI